MCVCVCVCVACACVRARERDKPVWLQARTRDQLFWLQMCSKVDVGVWAVVAVGNPVEWAGLDLLLYWQRRARHVRSSCFLSKKDFSKKSINRVVFSIGNGARVKFEVRIFFQKNLK